MGQLVEPGKVPRHMLLAHLKQMQREHENAAERRRQDAAAQRAAASAALQEHSAALSAAAAQLNSVEPVVQARLACLRRQQVDGEDKEEGCVEEEEAEAGVEEEEVDE